MTALEEQISQQDLVNQAEAAIHFALKAGADHADVVVDESSSFEMQVREGHLEKSERSESSGLYLRVFVGEKNASISADLGEDTKELTQRAVSMAKVVPDDVFNKLPDESLIERDLVDLDLFDASGVDVDQLQERIIACEEAMLEVPGVSKSARAFGAFGTRRFVLATSNGFSGGFQTSHHQLGACAIAGEGADMQTDYEMTAAIYSSDLDDLAAVGKKAGERAAAKLNPRKIESQSIPILFDNRAARSFISSFTSAISGAAIARGTSFLKDRLGQKIFNPKITILDDPKRKRQFGASPFDGEGVRCSPITLVDAGRLNCWLLDCSSAAELGLTTNGRAARSGGNTSPHSTHLIMSGGDLSPADIMCDLGPCLFVTDFIGHGIDLVTGDFSRGASGFWVEGGEITFPVSEITVAGNLTDIFANMTPANDAETKFSMTSPSLLVEGMTVAGV